jgi:hypothetical protein
LPRVSFGQDEKPDEAGNPNGRTGARAFFFTTFDQVGIKNILADPIWMQTGNEQSLALFPVDLAQRIDLPMT